MRAPDHRDVRVLELQACTGWACWRTYTAWTHACRPCPPGTPPSAQGAGSRAWQRARGERAGSRERPHHPACVRWWCACCRVPTPCACPCRPDQAEPSTPDSMDGISLPSRPTARTPVTPDVRLYHRAVVVAQEATGASANPASCCTGCQLRLPAQLHLGRSVHLLHRALA